MEDSVFTKIIKGELPCHKIYEDQLTISFLDIYPSHYGKTLVVSKKQIDQFIDLPEEDYMALWQTVRKVSIRLRQVIGKDRVGVVIKGEEVPHTHVHLIPFNEGDHLKADGPSATKEPDHKAFEELAKKLYFSD